MKRTFPSRSEFRYKNGIKVSTKFDGGNLLSCRLEVEDKDESKADFLFVMTVCGD